MGANGGFAAWDDVKIGESVHSCKVLENAGSVEEIEDDVVMAEHDSDEELPARPVESQVGARVITLTRGPLLNTF